MTHNQRKNILLFSGAAILGGIGFLVYKRQVNKRNSELMLEYISELPKINTSKDVTKLADEATANIINQVNSLSVKAMNGSTIIFDNKSYTLSTLSKTDGNEKALSIVKGIHDSINRVGTDVDKFISNFTRIGNKNAMIYCNILYKSLYGETMWEAINGEALLYYGSNRKADIFNLLDIPNYNPKLTTHLFKLK